MWLRKEPQGEGMDSSGVKPTKCAFWCGILERDAPSPASWREVRTVRGAYTTLREPAKNGARAADALPPVRPGERLT